MKQKSSKVAPVINTKSGKAESVMIGNLPDDQKQAFLQWGAKAINIQKMDEVTISYDLYSIWYQEWHATL